MYYKILNMSISEAIKIAQENRGEYYAFLEENIF